MAFFRKHFNLVLLFSGLALTLQGQPGVYSLPGPQGIYVFLGNNIPCGKPVFSYTIERREGAGEWKQIAEVKTPATFQAFQAALERSKSLLPAQPLPSGDKLRHLYEKAIKTGTTDSLKKSILHYPVRVALGLIYHDGTAKNGNDFQYRITESRADGQAYLPVITDTLSMPYKAVFNEVTLAETSRSDYHVLIKWKATGSKVAPLFMVHRVENQKPMVPAGITGRYVINDTTYFTYRDSIKPEQVHTELQYFMTPYDLLGNAGKSSQVVVITSDRFDKARFESLSVSRSNDPFGNTLSWKFNDPSTAKQLDIYRSEEQDKGYFKIGTLPGTASFFTDSIINPGKDYYYYVLAQSVNGIRSKPSDKVMQPAFTQRKLIPPVIKEAIIIRDGVMISIRDIDELALGIRVFRNSEDQKQMVAVTDFIPVTENTVVVIDSVPGISPDASYTYSVRCERPGYGISGLSEPVISSRDESNSIKE